MIHNKFFPDCEISKYEVRKVTPITQEYPDGYQPTDEEEKSE